VIYHDKNLYETQKLLKTNLNNGLSCFEAQQRLKTNGMNLLQEKNKKSSLKKFLSQFNDFMVIVLLLAAFISFGVAYLHDNKDFIDPVIILIIVLLNAIIGFVQENKAEKSIEALKKISAPTAKVIRDSQIKNIMARDIVIGDLILFETGDYIPADARLISSVDLKIDESALTGESVPVEKKHDLILNPESLLGDRANIIFCGSYVTYGRGRALVFATGNNTEVGKIANLIMSHEENLTPLQKKLNDTGKILGLGTLGLCALIFLIGILRKMPKFELFMTSVSLAVAAIPEGLPAIVTIVLAIGVRRMAKRKAIIKKLPAVETLGRANIICSDKTGTLTQNKMRLVETKNYFIKKQEEKIFECACLCSNVILQKENKNLKLIGDSTEGALVIAAYELGLEKKRLEKKFPRVYEIAFDSERKIMTTVHKCDKNYLIITKGAPDILLTHCKYYFNGEKILELDLKMRKKIIQDNKLMAQRALRVLGIAYKNLDNINQKNNLESDLIFLSLFGMIDPPREEVFEAVRKCRMAGIKPVMITGDHVLTAQAIAKQIGIMQPGDKFLNGLEISKISDQELSKNIYSYSLFARVSPEHKVKIIKAFKNNNAIVAMTGDGVNDAPALKIADIGCAMGTGTDIAKSAADMILLDDNFATIIKAIHEGRGIYSNIKKTVHFLLSSNIGEIITIFMAILFGRQSPLLAIQLLWVNLVTDSLPSIALGLEPPEEDIMQKRPDINTHGLFLKSAWQRIILEGCMIGILSLIAYAIGNRFYNLEIARTMSFAALSFSQLTHVFNMRSEKSLFEINIFSNNYLIMAFIICCVLQTLVITYKPLCFIFHTHVLNSFQWLIIIFLSLVPILIVELEKYWSRREKL